MNIIALARMGGCAGIALAFLAASPVKASDLSGEIGVVSDYRYRGISLSNGNPALQASVTLETDQGLYAELWTSTLGGPDDGADAEIDLTAGYSFDLRGNLSLDVAATYYFYPGEPGANYIDGTITLELVHGPATSRLGFSFAPRQQGTENEQGVKHANGYAFAGVSYELSKLPLTLNAELGYERGAFDETPRGGKWDWQFGGELKVNSCRLGLAYVGNGADGGDDLLLGSLFLEF